MDYYGKLLDAILQSLPSAQDRKTLALVADGTTSDESEQESLPRFSYPSELLPSDAELSHLPMDEIAVDAAVSKATEREASLVFGVPPFLGHRRISGEFRKRFGRLGLEEAFATEVLQVIAPTMGYLVMMVPRMFLAAARSDSWRQEFFPNHGAVVIEHDHELREGFGFHPMFQFATVVFGPQPGPVKFFKINEEAISEGSNRIISDIQRLIRQPAGKTQFGFVHQGPLVDRYPCSFDFYSEETQRLREEVGELGEKVALETVADVLMGYRPFHPERDAGHGETGFLHIGARNITSDGKVDLSELRPSERPGNVRHYLEEGDLCIRQIYAADGGFVVGVYEGDGRPITWNSTVIVVRPHASLSPAQRQVLLSFLRSPLAQKLGSAKQIMSSMGNHLRVTPSMLREFPVPIADQEIVTAIQHLSEARNAFSQWMAEIDEASDAIVRESTASGSRTRILESGQLARQRFRAATQVEELDYRIRTQFPHPLAYAWRELQVIGDDRFHRLRAVTRAAENHTCFLAQLAILMGRVVGREIKYVGEMSTRLSQRKGGTNFGDWFAILKEVNESRVFRDLPTDTPFVELQGLVSDDSWEQALRHLMDVRNDDSHGRISSTNVPPALISEAECALESVFKSSEFLTDYCLMLMAETKYDSIRSLNRYRYRDLTGDNALAPVRSDSSARNDLETGSLYIRDRSDNLHLLRPLLHYLECPECHQMSTFFLDTFDPAGNGIVGIKSFERNSVRGEPILEDMQFVGLLR